MNPGGTVHGVILIAALLAAETDLHDNYADTLASAVIASVLYWLAHAYSTLLGRRLTVGEHLSARALARALAHDWSLIRGAAIPLVVLAACWAAGADHQSAVVAAMWSAIACLALFEMMAGIRARATRSELALETAVGFALVLGVIALKILLR